MSSVIPNYPPPPAILRIEGSYWDSLIYRGSLYLFERDGAVITIDWDSFVMASHPRLKDQLGLTATFLRSDYLYGSQWALFFSDPDIRRVLMRKLENVAEMKDYRGGKQVLSAQVGEQDHPLKSLHADALVYRNTLYMSDETGVFAANVRRHTKHPISTRTYKLTDVPTVGLTASYQRLALAATTTAYMNSRSILGMAESN